MTMNDIDHILQVEINRRNVRVSLPAVKAVFRRGLTASGYQAAALSRVQRFLDDLTTRNNASPDADLFPTPAQTTRLIDALRTAEAACDTQITGYLLASAIMSPEDPHRIFNLNRALRVASTHRDPVHRASLTAALRALVADGNSSLARSLRARRQLRDRKGRWIEMGGGVRFKVRSPGAPNGGEWFHGRVEGVDVPNGRVDVRLEDGRLVKVPNDKLEQPKAILNLPGQPLMPATDPSQIDDPDAPEVDRLREVNEPTNRIAERAPSDAELISGAEDAGNELTNRIPQDSSERAAADQVAAAVREALAAPNLSRSDIQERLNNAAAFAERRGEAANGPEAEVWAGYAEDLRDVSAAAAPDDPNQEVGQRDETPAGPPTLEEYNEQYNILEGIYNDLPEGELKDRIGLIGNVIANVGRQHIAGDIDDARAAALLRQANNLLLGTVDTEDPDVRADLTTEISDALGDVQADVNALRERVINNRAADAEQPAPEEAPEPEPAPEAEVPTAPEPEPEPEPEAPAAEEPAVPAVDVPDAKQRILDDVDAEANAVDEEYQADLDAVRQAIDNDEPAENVSAAVDAYVNHLARNNPDAEEPGLEFAESVASYLFDRDNPDGNAPVDPNDPWAGVADPADDAQNGANAVNAVADVLAEGPFEFGEQYAQELRDMVAGDNANRNWGDIGAHLAGYANGFQLLADGEQDPERVAYLRAAENELRAVAERLANIHDRNPNADGLSPEPIGVDRDGAPVAPGDLVELPDSRRAQITGPANEDGEIPVSIRDMDDGVDDEFEIPAEELERVRRLFDEEPAAPIEDAPAPEAAPEPADFEVPPLDPNLNDQFGNDVPEGFRFVNERNVDGVPVQRYVSEDGNTTVETLDSFGVPSYQVRSAEGELLGEFTSWREALGAIAPPEADAPDADAEFERRQAQRLDERDRPVPLDWNLDRTDDGSYVYRGPDQYTAVMDANGQITLLRREEGGAFAQVGQPISGWGEIAGLIDRDRQDRPAEQRAALAAELRRNGFDAATIDAVQFLPNAEEARQRVLNNPRYRGLDVPGAGIDFMRLRAQVNAMQDLSGAEIPENETPAQAARRQIGFEAQRMANISDETVAAIQAAPTSEAIIEALHADGNFLAYSNRIVGLREIDFPQPQDRDELNRWQDLKEAINNAGNLDEPSDEGGGGGEPPQPDAPEDPLPTWERELLGEPAVPAPEPAPEPEPVPAEEEVPPPPNRQNVQRPAGAAPQRRGFHDANGIGHDRLGNELYAGLRVRTRAGAQDLGTIVLVNEETNYVTIRLDDGRRVVRSGRRVDLLRTDQIQPAAPAPAAAPAAPAPAAINAGEIDDAVNEILNMHRAGADRMFPLVDEVVAARDALEEVLEEVRGQANNPAAVLDAVNRAIAGYEAALAGDRSVGGDDYWGDVEQRLVRARALRDRLGPAGGAVDIPALQAEVEAFRASIPRRRADRGGNPLHRWRGGYALEDVIRGLQEGNLSYARARLEKAAERFRRNDFEEDALRAEAFRDRLGGEPAAPAPAPLAPDENFQPADWVAPRRQGDQVPVGQSPGTPGVAVPGPDANRPEVPALNAAAVQKDFNAWGPRANEIAEAARTRPSFRDILDLRGAELENAVKAAFGADEFGVAFGNRGFTLQTVKIEQDGSNVSAEFNVMDGNRVVANTTRLLKVDGRGSLNVYNSFMVFDNEDSKRNGFASAFNRHMENWYIANGVKYVDVGAGEDAGGYVWAINGFGWKDTNGVDPRNILDAIGYAATTDQERSQIAVLRRRMQAGDVPTPMEMALVGWNPSKGESGMWAGKRGMLGETWSGRKKLVPTDLNQQQAANYEFARNARDRAARGENTPTLSPEFVNEFSNNQIPGLDEVGLGQNQVADIAAVLSGNRSVADIPFAQKQKLFTWVNDRLRKGESNDADLFALRAALNNDIRADYPEQDTLGVGEVLRDVPFDDIMRNRVPGFKVTSPEANGINDTYKVTHDETGHVFYYKRERAGSRDMERDVAEMLRNAGWRGYGKFENHNSDPQVVIQQRAGDAMDFSERPKNARRASGDLSRVPFANYDDPLRFAMLDMLVSNGDRHENNFQVAKDHEGRWWIFPIDHGLANARRSLGDRSGENPSRWFVRGPNRVTNSVKRLIGARARGRDRVEADFRRIIEEYRQAIENGNYTGQYFTQNILAGLENLEQNIGDIIGGLV